MLRPGFLGESNRGPFEGLFDRGGGSKGDFEPPPEPPPSTGPEQFTEVKLPDGSMYQQDKRCPEGQKITESPCTDPDCDPGEMDYECESDPAFEEKTGKAEAAKKAKAERAKAREEAAAQREILAEEAAFRRQQAEELRAELRMQEEQMIKQYVTLGVAGIGVLTLGLILMKILRR